MNDQAATRRRVLVTRPAGEAAQRLCASVAAAGHEVYHQPLMELHGLPGPTAAQRALLLGLDRYQHVIFISGNAVRFGMALIDDFWPQVPAGLHWYAIGAATAADLARRNLEAIAPGGAMDSEALLAVAALQDVRGQRVLIVKGEGGRDTLRETLVQRGAEVDELACYRRNAPALGAGELATRIEGWRIDVILLSSGEGLANMCLLLSSREITRLKYIGLIVPSQRVARMAREGGFAHVTVAENASDAAMLRALDEWQPGTGEQ